MQNNISAGGVKARKFIGIIGVFLSFVITLVIVLLKPNLVYLIFLLPALYIAFVGLIQARKSFCVYHGFKGETNLEGAVCKLEKKEKRKSLTKSIGILFSALFYSFLIWIIVSFAFLTLLYGYTIKELTDQGKNVLSSIVLVKDNNGNISDNSKNADKVSDIKVPICIVCTSAEIDDTGNCPINNIFYSGGLLFSTNSKNSEMSITIDENISAESVKQSSAVSESTKLGINDLSKIELSQAIIDDLILLEAVNANFADDENNAANLINANNIDLTVQIENLSENDSVLIKPAFDDIVVQPIYLYFDKNSGRLANKIDYVNERLHIEWLYRSNDAIYNIGGESVDLYSYSEENIDVLNSNNRYFVLQRDVNTGWLMGDYIFAVYPDSSIVGDRVVTDDGGVVVNNDSRIADIDDGEKSSADNGVVAENFEGIGIDSASASAHDFVPFYCSGLLEIE